MNRLLDALTALASLAVWSALVVWAVSAYWRYEMRQPGYSWTDRGVVYAVCVVRVNGKPYYEQLDSARACPGSWSARMVGDTSGRVIVGSSQNVTMGENK